MKISIVTIVYNGENEIRRTLESVLSQKHSGVEYIVIDGKSTDRTVDIINEYAEKIDVFVSEKDEGIADAFNKGIRLANGDYICFINAGDILLDGVIDYICRNEDDISGYDVIYGDAQIYDIANDRIYDKKAFPIKMIEYCLPFSHQSCFISKDVYMQYGLYDKRYKICMDYALIREMYAKGVGFHYISRQIAMFSTGGVSYTKPVKTMQEDLSIAIKYGLPANKAIMFGTKHVVRHYIKLLLEKVGLFRYISKFKDRH